MLSFVKACFAAFWILLIISMGPMAPDVVETFKQSGAVRWVQNFEPTIENIVMSSTPEKIKEPLLKTLRNSVFENRKSE
jgi:hypothetical protein